MYSTFRSVMNLVIRVLNHSFTFLGISFSIWQIVCFGCLLIILFRFLYKVFD